jgi:molecular chaperone IbpA
MRSFDLTPLLRASVGFDRFDRLFDTVNRLDDAQLNYPPYNIEKSGEDAYRITMAVAGFGEGDLDLTVTENTLVVTGRQQPEQEGVKYLHRGIAGRAFERRFELADTIKVVGARIENGLLHIDLAREVPEHKKPRKIAIGAGEPKAVEQKKAA